MSQSSELVVVAGRFVRQLRRATGTDDVPTPTLRLLATVDELSPVTIGTLAEVDRCSQPTTSSAVRGLVERGWVTKRPNPVDARSSLVELTASGVEVLAAARARMADLVAARLRDHPGLEERDLATAITVLRAVLADPAPPSGRTRAQEGTA